jgi:osmotically-inducible protein OsmY
MSDDELQFEVTQELSWDPKVDSAAIAVSVDDGKVTLKGTVGSFREKREAKKAVERVWGVKSVHNDLQVRFLDNFGQDDADLRGAVLQALMLDSAVPKTIDAKVENGFVRLTGTAEWKWQREEAETVAGNVSGVIGVEDDVDVVGPTPDPEDIQKSIKHAFKRNASLDAEGISVESSHGTVTVSGVVRSWAEHDEALDAAWAAPGVTKVRDHLAVSY